MGTMNPRARGDGDLQSTLRRGRSDREQIRRLVTRQRPTPPGTGSGGIVGQLEIYAEDGFVIPPGEDADDGTALVWRKTPGSGAFTIAGDTSWFQAGAGAPYQVIVDEGWYYTTVGVQMFYTTEASAPSSYRVHRAGGLDSPPLDGRTMPRAHVGSGLWGLHDHVQTGPSYIREPIELSMETEGTEPTAYPLFTNLYMVLTKYA